MSAKAYRVAVVGDLASIIGYRGMSMDTFPVVDAEDTKVRMKKLVDSGLYAVIFVTETVMNQASELVEEQRYKTLPAIVSVPRAGEYLGLGKLAIHEAVRKAIGFNILGDWDQSYTP